MTRHHLQKEKSDMNRQDKQLKCLLGPLFFSLFNVERRQKEKMEPLMFSINKKFAFLRKYRKAIST